MPRFHVIRWCLIFFLVLGLINQKNSEDDLPGEYRKQINLCTAMSTVGSWSSIIPVFLSVYAVFGIAVEMCKMIGTRRSWRVIRARMLLRRRRIVKKCVFYVLVILLSSANWLASFYHDDSNRY